MIRITTLFFVLLAVGACSDTSGKTELSKEDAANRNDGVDYCSVYAWYGDGVCDGFCSTRDPDCDYLQPQPEPQPELEPEPEPQPQPEPFPCLAEDCGCPGFTDEVVTYFSRDPLVCTQDEISQVCPEGTQHFFIEECGCGCIGTPSCAVTTDERHYVAEALVHTDNHNAGWEASASRGSARTFLPSSLKLMSYGTSSYSPSGVAQIISPCGSFQTIPFRVLISKNA